MLRGTGGKCVNIEFAAIKLLPRTCMGSKGLSNCIVCLSVCYKNIENNNDQMKYAVIRSEKGTIITFELLFEGHIA